MLERIIANWPLKLLALALAFGIWVSVTGQTSRVKDFNPSLDIHLPEELVLASDPPTTVSVRLRGPDGAFTRISSLRPVVVELEDVAPGEYDVTLTERNLSGIPRGVEMEFIDPDRLKLEVDRRMKTKLVVEPVFQGSPPEGYFHYGSEARPTELEVVGPASEVEPLTKIQTSVIRLDTLTEPTPMSVSPAIPVPHLRVLSQEPLEVWVVVDEAPTDVAFPNVPVEIQGMVFETALGVETVHVVLSGPPKLLEQTRFDLLRAVVDVTGLAPAEGPYSLPIRLDYHDRPIDERKRITITSLEPSVVEVTISNPTSGL